MAGPAANKGRLRISAVAPGRRGGPDTGNANASLSHLRNKVLRVTAATTTH